MRLFALLFAAFLATALMSVSAQDVQAEESAGVAAPEASDPVPDWYQRFSAPVYGDKGENPDWAGISQSDVQVNLLRSRRWNVELALTSREGDTGLPREEVWAGASFNISPRLSIGGEVGVGSDDLGPGADWGTQEVETGIRLRSAFKF